MLNHIYASRTLDDFQVLTDFKTMGEHIWRQFQPNFSLISANRIVLKERSPNIQCWFWEHNSFTVFLTLEERF